MTAPAQTAFGQAPRRARRLWSVMPGLGKVRSRRPRSERRRAAGEVDWYIDFWPYQKTRDRFLWADHGQRFEGEAHAEGILEAIRGLHSRGMPLAEAVSQYRAPQDRRFRVLELAERWLEDVAESGDLSPYTLRDYRSFHRNQFQWWGVRTIHEVSWPLLDAWRKDMRAGGLGARRQGHALHAFRAFLSWYRRHEAGFVLPPFPKVKKPRPKRRTMPLLDQVAALVAVPEADRGVFLMLAWLAKRQGEGRAVLVGDVEWRERRLWVGRALKGDGSRMVVGETKTGDEGWYPIPDELWDWLQQHVPTARRFQRDAPLFANPRTGRFYRRDTIQTLWRAACRRAGVEHVPPNQALRHSTLSEIAPLIGILGVQSLSGHADINVLRKHYIATHADTKQAAIDARQTAIDRASETVEPLRREE